MINFVNMFHSGFRWVVLVVIVVALVKWGLGWLQKKSPDLWDRRLEIGYTSAIDIQVLVGIVLLVLQAANGILLRVGIEHAVVMVIAAVIAHLTMMWRKRNDTIRLRNNVLDALAVLVLIAVGVATVGGWTLG